MPSLPLVRFAGVEALLGDVGDLDSRVVDLVGVLLSSSPRGIPRRVVMSRDSPRSERDGARNTRI